MPRVGCILSVSVSLRTRSRRPTPSRHTPGRRFKGKDTTIPSAASGRAFPPSGRFFPPAKPLPGHTADALSRSDGQTYGNISPNSPKHSRKTPPLSFPILPLTPFPGAGRGTTGCVSGAQKKHAAPPSHRKKAARRALTSPSSRREKRIQQRPPLFPRFRGIPGIRRAVVSKEKIQPYRLRPPAVLFPLRAAFFRMQRPARTHGRRPFPV